MASKHTATIVAVFLRKLKFGMPSRSKLLAISLFLFFAGEYLREDTFGTVGADAKTLPIIISG